MPHINSTRQPPQTYGGYDNDAGQQLEDAARRTDQAFERGSISAGQRERLHQILQEIRQALASALSRRAQPYVAWGALSKPGITLSWHGPDSYVRISRDTDNESWDVTYVKQGHDSLAWTTTLPFEDPEVKRVIMRCTGNYSSDRWNMTELVKRQGECLLRINAHESGSPANWRIEIADTGQIVQSGIANDARDAMRDSQLNYEEMNRNIKRRRRGELHVEMPLDARAMACRNQRRSMQGMPKNERHGKPREITTPAITLRKLLTALQEQKPMTIMRFDEALSLNVNPAGVFVPWHEERICHIATDIGTERCVQDIVRGCDNALRVYGRHIGDYAVMVRDGDRDIPLTGGVRNERGFCLQSLS